jgi:hypothetical protein
MLKTINEAKEFVKSLFQDKTDPFSVNILDGFKEEHFEVHVCTKQFYCLFKRKFFFKFGEIFGKKGAGESINRDILDKILLFSFDNILIIYPNRRIYCCDPKSWINYVTNNNTTRTTKDGEVTTSIPLSLLTRL